MSLTPRSPDSCGGSLPFPLVQEMQQAGMGTGDDPEKGKGRQELRPLQ